MTKKKNYFLFFCAIMLVFSLLFVPFMQSKADSGFDFDYDSGGSDFGGSDFGGSFGSDIDLSYGAGSGSVSSLIGIIAFATVIVIILLIKKKQMAKNYNPGRFLNSYVSDEQIRVILPNFQRQEFLDRAYDIFVKVQEAWMNFDLESVRNLLSDDMYSMYTSQLDTLKIKNQKNIMKDFALDYMNIQSIKEENGKVSIEVLLDVVFKDYIINTMTNEVVRGLEHAGFKTTYVLTFVVSKNFDPNREVTCPNCHAKTKVNQAGKCEYCDSILVNNQYDYVLTKKQFIKKERKY